MSWNHLPEHSRDLYARILTPLQLDVLRHHLNGHSFRVIGSAMNLDESTCRGHWRRGLERIRRHKEQQEAA